jgi:hypothetical protein
MAESQPTPEKADQTPAEPGKLTQAEVDAIVEDRLAREKKKYADYGDLKKAAAELAELKKSQMTELEKLKADLAEKDTLIQIKDQELTGLKLERVKAEKLAAAKVPQDWIDSVTGSDEKEVEASVAKIAARLKIEIPAAAQGGGNPGVPNPPPASKIWTEKEIKELRMNGGLTDSIMEDLRKATAEGRVQ